MPKYLCDVYREHHEEEPSDISVVVDADFPNAVIPAVERVIDAECTHGTTDHGAFVIWVHPMVETRLGVWEAVTCVDKFEYSN